MVAPPNPKTAVVTRWALRLALLGGAPTVAFLGCSDDEHAKPATGASGSSNTAGLAGKASHAGTGTNPAIGGAAPEAGGTASSGASAEGGTAALGGADTEGPPGVAGDPGIVIADCPNDDATQPAGFTGVCTAAKGWAPGSDVSVASDDGASLVGVTPDELTLLWSEARSSLPTYFLADRGAKADAFGEAQELPLQNVVGLSPDGLRLTLAGTGNLLEATRSERGESFGEADAGLYSELNADAVAHHLTLGEVAFSPDDQTLYYSAWSLDDYTTYPLHVSSRIGTGPWPVGHALEECQLKALGAFGPRPTAVSSDGLTLFYFDAARRTARAAFRATVSANFSWFVDLPGVAQPQPNVTCDQLYYSPSAGNSRLLTAPRKP